MYFIPLSINILLKPSCFKKKYTSEISFFKLLDFFNLIMLIPIFLKYFSLEILLDSVKIKTSLDLFLNIFNFF